MENINQNSQFPAPPDSNNQSVPSIPPLTSSQTSNSRPVILYIIIVVLLLGLGFLGYEVYSLKKLSPVLPIREASSTSTPLPSPTQNNDPTANWKTYTGQDPNFTFKYPSDVYIDQNYSEKYNLFLATEKADTVTEMSLNAVWMSVGIYTNYDATELTKYPADKWNISYLPIKGASTKRSFTATYRNGSVVYIVTMNSKTDAALDKYENTFNQILASFEFSKPLAAIPTDWSAYSNADFNYSLNLPRECKIINEDNMGTVAFMCKDFSFHIRISDFTGTTAEFPATIVRELQSVDPTISPASLKEIKVNGLDAYYLTYTWEGGGETYYFLHNHKRIMIDKQPETPPQQNVFDQILSTFKFTQ